MKNILFVLIAAITSSQLFAQTTFFSTNFNDTAGFHNDWITIPRAADDTAWRNATTIYGWQFYDNPSINGTRMLVGYFEPYYDSALYEIVEMKNSISPSSGTITTVKFEHIFYQAFGSDAEGFVEVWDGTEWTEIYSVNTGTSTTVTPVSINVEEYSNPQFKLRFIYTKGAAKNCWSWSIDNLEVMGSGAVGVSHNKITQTLNIYPNPTSGRFSISLPKTHQKPFTLRVINLLGQQKYAEQINIAEQTNHIQINLSMLENGFYQLFLESSEAVYTSRILKQ